MNKKITIVGAGNVGASIAQMILSKGIGDVALLDIAEGIPQGKALDLRQSIPLYGHDCKITGTNSYKETVDSDIVIITAGLARKPGISREDLLKANAEIVKSVTQEVSRKSPHSIIVMVTNPLDLMTYIASEISGFPKKRVFGMGGVLDSARFSSFIAEELNVSIENINPMVIGNHGDMMVPLPRYTTVSGTPVTELLSRDKIERLVERTRRAGAEIVGLLKTGSAYYAPAAATVEMVDSIMNNSKKTLPCSAYLDGEYGVKGIYAGVPVVLGTGGVEKIIELELTEEEKNSFLKSIDAVREGAKLLEGLL
jgi:malate dehydrogenase